MGVNEQNSQKLISFAMGQRFEQTPKLCPYCYSANLFEDKMSKGNTHLFVCFNCNYSEEWEENE